MEVDNSPVHDKCNGNGERVSLSGIKTARERETESEETRAILYTGNQHHHRHWIVKTIFHFMFTFPVHHRRRRRCRRLNGKNGNFQMQKVFFSFSVEIKLVQKLCLNLNATRQKLTAH